jgi:hypothetical protein
MSPIDYTIVILSSIIETTLMFIFTFCYCINVKHFSIDKNWTRERKRRMWPFIQKKSIFWTTEININKSVDSLIKDYSVSFSFFLFIVWHSHLFLVNCRTTKHLKNENIENMQLLNHHQQPCDSKSTLNMIISRLVNIWEHEKKRIKEEIDRNHLIIFY